MGNNDIEFLKSLAGEIDKDLEALYDGKLNNNGFTDTELKIRQFVFEAEGTSLDKWAKQYQYIHNDLLDNDRRKLSNYLYQSQPDIAPPDLTIDLAILEWAKADTTYAFFEEYVWRIKKSRIIDQGAYEGNSTPVTNDSKLPIKLRFVNDTVIDKLAEFLSPYFDGSDKIDLRNKLAGIPVDRKLIFNYYQVAFVDVFWRLRVNTPPYLLSGKTEIKTWICSNFKYIKKGEILEFGSTWVESVLEPSAYHPHNKKGKSLPGLDLFIAGFEII